MSLQAGNSPQGGKVRVRFAPSPTGPLHIGGVRTALYNYLFAKKHGGDFILRIEDTDQNRYVEGAENYIIDTLNWCGIPFDEGVGKEKGYGPYRQSERKHLYKNYADALIASGNAYYAFDTADALEKHRADHEDKGKTFIYNHHNRQKLDNSLTISKANLEDRLSSGEEYVIRFKSNSNDTMIVHDIIRGEIAIDTSVLDDKVLFKSDGMPTYHLANIVDDHLMEITHVIRGEEWLPSLPLHFQLYEAFGWEKPQFAHLPLLMKPQGKGKLSKRDGDKMGFPVFPLEWRTDEGEIYKGYRETGYLPEAVINMLALLGWNPGTEQEIFSLEQLVDAFELERVHKSGAKFDPDKAKWFQNYYLQQQPNAFLAKEFKKLLDKKHITTSLDLEVVVALIKERATFVTDFWEQSSFLFKAPIAYDEKAVNKSWNVETDKVMQALVIILKEAKPFNEAHISEKVKGWITDAGIGFGRVMQPLRLALVGEMKGPDVFSIMALLGKEESIQRIENALKRLG
ncbi:MAG: glutamate--tRNA ligase [Flavobacteriaceae bacterium CG2_30_34_30]|nr:MAG: glutamate--tRNA ligase [Flavobacteriaceae bacterium CG2_30_34_30]PIQ19369.1 MAG: glutamate--tRNA ligase [Flavobacteriaceae bacterium CG18_big_fil_WC_8_21_14_2_50_34_36]PIZ08625.1 MAG: glutamate--tRNA ligase [Flavobacteriaceae bacterium CG_4_10_14_0_8_um_filter_34_31]